MLPRLTPADASRVPFYRLAALGIAWFFPLVSLLFLPGTLSSPVMAVIGTLVYPSVRKAILVAGIVVQGMRIVRPDEQRPQTYVFARTQGEIGLLLLALFMDFGVVFANRSPGVLGSIAQVIDWGFVLWIFAFRDRTVIDGVARTVRIGDPFARTFAFDAVRGLGMLEVRLTRRGQHVSTVYHLALVGQDGKMTAIWGYPTPQDVSFAIETLARDTGIPIARGA